MAVFGLKCVKLELLMFLSTLRKQELVCMVRLYDCFCRTVEQAHKADEMYNAHLKSSTCASWAQVN